MPAYSTHYIFARELADEIKSRSNDITLNENMLFFGTQGPDVFFFHRILPFMRGKSLNKIGSKLHRADPALIFAAMADYLENEKCDKDTVKSYIYGFLLHYALDRVAHPYIYSVQNAIIEKEKIKYMSGIIHNRIEFNIDAMMLREKLDYTDARKFKAGKTLKKDELAFREISKLMQYVISKVIGENLSVEDITLAYYDTITIQKLLTDNKGYKIPLMTIIQAPFSLALGPCLTAMIRHRECDNKWDYMNASCKEWSYPLDKSKRFSQNFYQLYDIAKQQALMLVDGFNKCIDTAELTQHLSFLTGLAVTD